MSLVSVNSTKLHVCRMTTSVSCMSVSCMSISCMSVSCMSVSCMSVFDMFISFACMLKIVDFAYPAHDEKKNYLKIISLRCDSISFPASGLVTSEEYCTCAVQVVEVLYMCCRSAVEVL